MVERADWQSCRHFLPALAITNEGSHKTREASYSLATLRNLWQCLLASEAVYSIPQRLVVGGDVQVQEQAWGTCWLPRALSQYTAAVIAEATQM